MEPTHLCVLYIKKLRCPHPILEAIKVQEIVLLAYVIIDVRQNKIVGMQEYMLKPDRPEIRRKLLSEDFTQRSPIKEMLSNSCTLESAIKHFQQYVESTFSINLSTHSLRFVTHGQLSLRELLYPEACSKNFELPQYYALFHDLSKEFNACYKRKHDTYLFLREMFHILQAESYRGSEYCVKKIGDIVKITQTLISDGHKFKKPERINLRLVPKIYKNSEEVKDDCVVLIQGLLDDCSEQDVAKFFIGLNIAEGGVALCLSREGRRNGLALVRFENKKHCRMALRRYGYLLANNPISVHKVSKERFITLVGGNREANAFLSKGAEAIIQMRELPVDCTAMEVLTFFSEGENSCEVMLGERGVLFVKNSDGDATGIALVLFEREEDAGKALRKTNKEFRSRSIQLFPSTFAEAQQVLKIAVNAETI